VWLILLYNLFQDFVVAVGDAAVVVDRDDIRFVSQPLPPIKHFNK
jgi:hypothetical protein